MVDGPIRGRDVFLEPLVGTAYVVVLTSALVGIGYLISVAASWLA